MAKSTAKANPKKSVGRYVAPEARGRSPLVRSGGGPQSALVRLADRRAARVGMLIIVLNYLSVLPGSTSSWYLVRRTRRDVRRLLPRHSLQVGRLSPSRSMIVALASPPPSHIVSSP